MDPVTGLHHGTQTGWMREVCVCVWLGSESSTVTLIRLHLVAITAANTTQAGWHISSLQSNLRLGHGWAQAACGRRGEDKAVLVLMHFWTLVSAKWHAVLLFDVSENTLFLKRKKRRGRWLCIPQGDALFSCRLSCVGLVQCGIPDPATAQCGSCLFARSHLFRGLRGGCQFGVPSKKKKKQALRLVQGLY